VSTPDSPSRCGSVEVEAVAEKAATLRELGREARERQLFLLVDGRVDAPAGRVSVAPLAADRERIRRHCTLSKPSREELLGAPVAARDVDVADAGGAGGVQHVGDARVHRVRRPLRQVVRAAERDVAGSRDRGEADADPRHRQPATTEWTSLRRGGCH
jgi:hypothetical protein